MNRATNGTPNLYALLIGVDHYLPNKLPDGTSYQSLGGCVRDITHMEEFLRSKLGIPKEHILRLTASNTGATEPPEPRKQWPTYENMVTAFQRLTDIAQPGYRVIIHYSGHGGRVPTKFPDLKGANGLDEALVPTDIGNSTARYLRDIELAHILKTMVDKGLIVTIILDSCHSGGATRGMGGAVVRGLSAIDTTPRPAESLVASDEELAQTWHSLVEGTTRAIKPGSGWLPEPKGYVLLAACRPSESAYEYAFEGQEKSGALTYWLLDSLKQIGPGLTYKLLHDRIVAKVHGHFVQQTPQLQGEGNRVVFGSDQVQPQYAVNVMRVDLATQRVLLNTGQAQSIHKGAQFAVYPYGSDLAQVDQRLALAEIESLGATDSWARITVQLREGLIEQGAQAVLLDPGSVRLRRSVCLVHREDTLPTIDQDRALNQVERAIAESGTGWIQLAADEEPADYQVAVNAEGKYEIWDSAGQPFPNLRPTLEVDESGAAARVVDRLIHLTKYHNILQLDNFDQWSPLAGKLTVELVRAQPGYQPGDRPEPQPFDDPGNTPTLDIGEWILLRIKNASSQVVNVTALDLAPDWGVGQLVPSDPGACFEPFDPGQEQLIPIRAGLPSGCTEGTDVIKVFATVGATDFHWLELPALDQPPERRTSTPGGPNNPLEELLVALAVEGSGKRKLNPAAFPSREWVTAQVEVHVLRGLAEPPPKLSAIQRQHEAVSDKVPFGSGVRGNGMTYNDTKPIIFTAFASAWDDRVEYLRQLPEEARRIRRTLEHARREGLCELVERSNATLDDILDVFQTPEYRNRIAVFHFGGHANGYQLLLESAEGVPTAANAGGLAAFLGQQRGLQLVFLNGCSTQQQVSGLLEAQVAVVIATSRAIEDQVATEFASRFYQSLAAGDGIRTAYSKAQAALQAAYGRDMRKLYAEGQTPQDRWPWELYPRQLPEVAARWNLPYAADNPYFGLPPLPKRDLPDSPFRRLRWFAEPHAEVFFGRGYWIRDLYQAVTDEHTSPIILLYGQSGVGKSSLLAAGLIPRLREGGYEFRHMHRDPAKGLLGILREALLPHSEDVPLAQAWSNLERELDKPLIVIVDQVEEVFTRARADQPDELAAFLDVVQSLFADPGRRPGRKLLMGFRKEWLAEIERQLIDHRLPYTGIFLERLDRRGIIEAVAGPAHSERLQKHYGLTVDEELPTTIAEYLLEDPGSPIAPTLQILLTKMWEAARKESRSKPHFSEALYESLKREGILLGDFLGQQLDKLEQWRAEPVTSGLALDLLAFHTTPRGYAEQRLWTDLCKEYEHRQDLPELVQKNKELYLLVDPSSDKLEAPGSGATRLAHDTLGPLVRQRFDESTAPGQRAHSILKNRAVEWKEGKEGTPLEERDLELVEAGKAGMRRWRDAERRLVDASRNKRAEEQRKRRLRLRLAVAAVLLILVSAGVAGWQWLETTRAHQRADARDLVIESQSVFENDPLQGLFRALQAWEVAPVDERIWVEQVIRDLAQYGRLLKLGEDDIENVYFSAYNSVYVLDRANATGELRHTVDRLVVPLSGEISQVTFSSDPAEAYFVVKYGGAPSELRRTADGSIVPLTGALSKVYFSPGCFVVDYGDKPGELRRTTDGSLLATLTKQVASLQFSPGPAASYFVVDYDDDSFPSELRRSIDGLLVATLTSKTSRVQFSPDPATTFMAVEYGEAVEDQYGDVGHYNYDLPAELRRTADGSIVATLTSNLAAIVSIDFSPDPAATYLIAEFVEPYEEIDFSGVYSFDDRYIEVRRTADGSVVPLTEDVFEVYFSPDPDATYFAVSYTSPTPRVELHRTADGTPVPLTSESVEAVHFGVDHFVVSYDGALPELRRIADGSVVAVLDVGSTQEMVSGVEFSPSPETGCFVIDYAPRASRDGGIVSRPAELRRTADGSLVVTLPGRVRMDNIQFSPDPAATYLAAHYENGVSELRHTAADSSRVSLTYGFSWVEFTPDLGAEYFVIGLRDGSAELRRTSDGAFVTKLTGQVTTDRADFSSDGSHLVVQYDDGRSELWDVQLYSRPLADLGWGKSDHLFDLENQRLIVWYTDGRTYLLDLEWLQVVMGDPTFEEIVQLVCQALTSYTENDCPQE
jgi:hypothetical protein